MASGRPSLLSLRWILAHLLVLAVVAAMVALGMWQWSRYGEVSAEAERLEARLASDPVPFGDVADLDAADADPIEALEYRQVEVTGRYRPEDEVLQRSRSYEGRSGYHVLTPLDVGDDLTVLVRRGWVPFAMDQPPVSEARPPDGEVTLTGFLERAGEQPSGFGQRDPEEGHLDRVFHADVGRLERQIEGPLFPMLVHLEEQVPSQTGDLPVPAARPSFDAGQNLSYTFQWFAFGVIAATAYGFWLRRRVRHGPEEPTEHARDASA